jgi:hypothetical protein
MPSSSAGCFCVCVLVFNVAFRNTANFCLDRVLLLQIDEQQYRFGKIKPTEKPEEKGVMTFYHPPGTHDDQLWALALALYAAK